MQEGRAVTFGTGSDAFSVRANQKISADEALRRVQAVLESRAQKNAVSPDLLLAQLGLEADENFFTKLTVEDATTYLTTIEPGLPQDIPGAPKGGRPGGIDPRVIDALKQGDMLPPDYDPDDFPKGLPPQLGPDIDQSANILAVIIIVAIIVYTPPAN